MGQSEQTIVARFRERARTTPGRVALRSHDGDGWTDMSWIDYATAVEHTAAGLIDLGVSSGDRVAIASINRPEWHIADLATMSVGAVTVPIYPTSSSSQIAYILADCGARVCFVDDAEQLAKILLRLDKTPDLDRIVVFGPAAGYDRPSRVMTLNSLQRSTDIDAVTKSAEAVAPNDLATLVCTSGTTGPPKGTCITHANISWTIDSVEEMVKLNATDRWLSYLPLSHIAERVTSHFGQIAAGGETWFARSLATVPEDLQSCRPTVFMAVPRIWQKLHDSIVAGLDAKPVHLSRLLDNAASAINSADHAPPPPGWLQRVSAPLVDKTLGRAIRRKLGLDQARLLVSAAAPIHPDLIRWFHGVGLPIAEVYGQTEDCGPATINPPDAIRIGSVGKVIPGLEIRVDDEGELLFRGGSVCSGYFGQPDATEELIDNDGWMHSGDLGRIDDDGYVWITGRKKDLIINAAGKNIAPSEIEARLSMESMLGQAVVVGDGRRFLTALLTLDVDAIAGWANEHDAFNDIAELARDPRVRSEVEASVGRVNSEHAPVEQIKYWRILPDQLTIEGGDLTPTLKVRRDAVQRRHRDLIEAMYTERA